MFSNLILRALLCFVGLLYMASPIVLNAQSFEHQSLNKAAEVAYFVSSNLQDYDGDGDLDIIIGQGEPSGLYWLENEPTQQFPKHPLVTENIDRIADVDIADFDNDGDLDYVVCMSRVDDGELAWFQRQEDGTYIKWTIGTNKDYIMADVADFDGDGWMDIAAVGLGNSDETLRIYFNQGNLFFEEKIVANDCTEAVDAEDIDNDGDIDIAVGGSGLINNPNSEDSGARILLNDGEGNFTLRAWLVTYTNSHASIGETIQIVDLNGDGAKDVLGFSSIATGGLYFFDGADDFKRTLLQQEGLDAGADFVVFDVDGNGLLDIVRQEWTDGVVFVLYQTGNMVFEKEYIELNWNNVGNPTAKMSVGDLDQDGDLDLVFPEKGSIDDDLAWFENIDGKLYRHYIYTQLSGARIPKFVDIDNDGDLDIVVTVTEASSNVEENEVLLFENLDGTNFINWRINEVIDYPADIEPVDIDGDGDADLVVTARDADDLVWFENTGRLYDWTYHQIEDNANAPLGCAVGDLDNDGDPDIALCSHDDDKVFWYRNDGSGNFIKGVIAPLLDAPRAIELGDLDGDGDLDAAIACTSTENTVTIYANNGSGLFSQKILYTGKSARDIELGDWNADGLLDILASMYAASATTPKIDVLGLLNEGDNNFTIDPILVGVEKTNGIRLADLDGDTDLDIVLGFDGDYRVLAGIHQEDKVDIYALSEIKGGDIYGIDIGDVNQDGILDIVFADFKRDELNLLTINCIVAPTPEVSASPPTCDQHNGSATVSSTGFLNPTYQWSDGQTSQTAVGLAPGEYQVTVSSENGCSATAGVNIVSLATAQIDISSSDTSCGANDGSAAVNVSNDVMILQYAWSNGVSDSVIDSLPGGTYTVTVTDENGCQITESITITPFINPTIDLGDEILINAGETVTIQASGTDLEYLWSTGEETQSITVGEPGEYAVTVTNDQGCTATDSVHVAFVTAVFDPYLDKTVIIYPNPIQEILRVKSLDPKIAIQQLKFFAMDGQEIVVEPVHIRRAEFAGNLSHLPQGIYLLVISTSAGQLSKFILKQ